MPVAFEIQDAMKQDQGASKNRRLTPKKAPLFMGNYDRTNAETE